MKRNFILDKEIDLLGKDSDNNSNDNLNTIVYANVLKETIANAPKNNSFTIGLFGEWGSGKSSIIKTVKSFIDGEKTDEKIKMITYDAWKYANDSFRRMFLLLLQNELNFEQSEFMNSFYYNTTSDTKVNVKLNTKRIILFIISYIILSFGIYFLPIPIEFKFTSAAILPLVTLGATLYFKMFDDLKVSVQKPHIFAPEQFEECFNQMVEKSLKKYSSIDKRIKYVKGEMCASL